MRRTFVKSQKRLADFSILRANRGKTRGKQRKDRTMRFQSLEARHMLAAAIWHNAVHPVDVSGDPDSQVSPIDALLIINELNRTRFIEPGTGVLPREIEVNPNLYFDVDCDGKVAPIDALIVINYLNRGEPANGPAPGSGGVYSTSACAPEIRESDRFVSELTQFVRLPNDESAIRVLFETPEFDLTAQQSIRDAFEIEVTDEDGNPVSLPYNLSHDAVMNWTESFDPVVGPGTNVTTEMETGIHAANINLAGLAEGSLVYVTARLVNNDNDNLSRVLFRGIEIVDSEAPAPTGMSPASSFRANATDIDFESLEDISGSVIPTYGRTTLRGNDNELVTSLVVTNVGSQAVNGQLIVALDQFSELDTFALRPDGFLPDDRPFFDLSGELTNGLLLPGDSVQSREFAFKNDSGQRFQYRLTTYGKLNVAPSEFVSTPLANIEAGRTYRYVARATDPDGQSLTYTKIAGPESMVADADSGEVRWETTASDVGVHQVILRATDPFGLFVEQSFNVEVVASLQNRPPIFISDPVTDAIASSGFEITTVATGAQPAGVEIISGFRGPRLVTINAGDQTVGVYAGQNNDRFDDATVYSTGEPRPTGRAIDVGYSVDVGLPSFLVPNDSNDVLGMDQGDFNGDGILDLVVLTKRIETTKPQGQRDTIEITRMLGDGNGNFSSPLVIATIPLVPNTQARHLRVADIDGDGRLDVIAIEETSSRLITVRGLGNGEFEPGVLTTLATSLNDYRLVDLDGDGQLDIVGRNANVTDLGWMRGVGDGTFEPFVRLADGGGITVAASNYSTRSYDFADLNGDGHLDIVLGEYNSGNVVVLLNDGEQNFSIALTIDPPGGFLGPIVLHVADFTGDGELDIFTVNHWRGRVDLFVGDGTGTSFTHQPGTDLYGLASNAAGSDGPVDINGDGHLDIVLTNAGTTDPTSPQVLINDGLGNFTRSDYPMLGFSGHSSEHNQTSNDIARGAMFGDYNGDGVMDLIFMTAGNDFNGVGIRLGTRPGEFGATRTIAGQNAFDSDVHAADFNGDGIVDLLLLRSASMMLGNGDGTFAEPFPAVQVARPGTFGAVADFNLDGVPDYVAVRNLNQSPAARFYVALANGDGTFDISDDQPASGSFYGYQDIRIEDFNNDGYPDIIAKAGVERIIDVYLNDPDDPGTFSQSFRTVVQAQGVDANGFTNAFATGDFDGDGNIDFVAVDQLPGEPQKLVLFSGDGAGNFSATKETFAFDDAMFQVGFYYPGVLQSGDVNGDGILDVVSFGWHGAIIHMGNGDGTFTSIDHYPREVFNHRAKNSYLIDFDEDGHLDLVQYNQQETLIIRRGFGDGTFGDPERVGMIGRGSPISFADLDHDGHLDMAMMMTGAGNYNNGDAVLFFGARDGLVDHVAADLNGDGNEEILAINEANDRLKIFLGDNLGGLTRQVDLFTGRAPQAVSVGDLNGDGLLEIITANRAGRSISVFTGSIASGYNSIEIPVGNGPIDVQTADVNGDGQLDVLVVDDSANALWILTGSADGTLSDPIAIALGDKPGRFTIDDATGDGELNAVITLPESNRVMILGGLGFESDAPAPIYIHFDSSPSDVVVTDLNADGKPDLAVTLPDENVLSVLFGLGGGQFARPQRIAVGEQPTRVTLADADEDGRMDLIVTNSGDGTASVIYNRFDPNEVYRYNSEAIDPDDDPINYSIVDGPGGLIINSETGALLWAASPDQVGVHEVTLQADDGRGGIATQSFKIDVQPARDNAAPLFATEPATTIGANETFRYQATALDNDRDTLRYRLLDGPTGAAIDPTTGEVTWDARTDLAIIFAPHGNTSTGRIEVAPSPSLQPASLTVEAWYNFHTLPASNQRTYLMTQAGTHGRAYALYNFGNSSLRFEMDFGAPVHNFTYTIPFVPTTNRWYHIALTIDDATRTATVFVDGAALGSTAIPNAIQYNPATRTQIGDSSAFYTRAIVDNYRIWNVVRTPEGIAEGLSRQYENDPRIVLDYRFDLPDTLTVRDYSPAGNHGYRIANAMLPPLVPGLADPGSHEFVIGVEDGRGGFDSQTFTVEVLPELRGAIQGKLFDDLNGDGLQDLDEPLLSGWHLFIDTNANGFADPHEMQATTDTNGHYTFSGLLPGTFPVRVTPVAGYQTPSPISATVTANAVAVHDLAIEQLALSHIRGQLLTDNAEPIAFWKVFADLDNNGLLDDDEPVAVSDRDGNFALTGLAAGTYPIRPLLPAGWLDTAGRDGLTVTLSADQIAGDNDFVLRASNTSVTGGVHFVSTPTTSIEARQTFRYASIAIGLFNEAIQYELSLAPTGMTIDPATGLVAWRPEIGQVGEHLVILRATSASGSLALQDFSVDVAAPNTPPVLSDPFHSPRGVGSDLPTAYVGLVYAVDLSAQDAEEHAVTFTLLNGPSGATLHSSTGQLRWTPAISDLGQVPFSVELRDELNAISIFDFSVDVAVSQPASTPFAITLPRNQVGLGQAYFAQIRGADALDRPLSWTLTSGPDGMSVSANGTLQWTPSNADFGDQAIELQATDVDGSSEVVQFTLQVVGRPVNSAPQITSTPNVSTVLGYEYQYDVLASDADSDPLAFAFVEAPVGMSLHPSLGTIRWTPSSDQLGEATVTLQVIDPDGRTDTQSFKLKVSRFGGPPKITSIPPTHAAVGTGYLYSIAARDAEGDPLTYRLLAAPVGMTIVETTGIISWTPSLDQVGQQDVVLEVSDGIGGAATQAFAIRVGAGIPNLPPQISSEAPRFAVVGGDYSYQLVATDPESTAITYSLGQAPDGLAIDPATGQVTWSPSASQVGQFIVTLIATDAGGASAIESFQVDVLAENDPPTIVSDASSEVMLGVVFTYQVIANDIDRDPLSYTLANAPAGASIDAFGKISWPTLGVTIGDYQFSVLVQDPRGGQATQSFEIAVVPDTEAPKVSLIERPNDGSRNILPWQGPFVVYVRAIDNVEIASLTLTANGRDIPLDAAGTATFAFEDWTFQRINATATAIDTSGNITTRTISFDYDFPEGWSGAGTQDIPTAIISSPTEAAAVFGMVTISGTADHADFDSYRLSYRRADESTYTEFHSSRTAVTNGELGVWDTSLLLNDEYFIRLEVATAGGIVNVAEHNVGLSGNLKLGDFQLEFTDLIVPIANAQIEFTRVYDTLQSDNQGDFGHGWRLEYRDTDLHVGLPESGLEDIGIYPALRPGVKVYLNIPGEGRIGFTFDPDIRVLPGWGGNNLVLARPRFTADRGVNATLSTGIGNYLHVNEFGELMAPGGIPYNPASPSFGGGYVVKTSDGTSYRIDGESGELLNIQDSAGNMVSFADDGIYDGQRRVLSFVRDSAGRITQVLDPIGANIQYRYSSAGDLIGVTDRAGNESIYTYDDTRPHFLKDYVDPNNQRVVRNEYSDDGRLIRQVDASGESTAISYDIGNRLVIVTDELGNDTGLEYDNRGLLVAQADALGNTTRREYDENGNQIRLTDATGAETRSTFNHFGSQTSLTDALGNVTRWTYDQFGNTLTEVSPTGLRTSATFDDRGLQTSMTNASGGLTQFTLNAFGETETVGLPTYTSMNFGYENGLPVSITDSDDADVEISYDDLNQPTRIADLNSGTSFDVEYDANGNLTSVTDVFGAVITYEYDANGNVIATEDALGNRTIYQYDPAGRLIQTTYADGLYESNEYDVAGRLVQKRDRAGHETRYVYDAVGRVVTIVEPDLTPTDPTDNPRINYEYDAVGRMTASINQLGAKIEYQYDPIGNLIRIIDPMGGETIRRYDGESRLVETIDPVERRTRYGYDASGNQESLELNDGSIFITEHDRNGLPLRATDAVGVTKHFQYGQYGRLLAVVEAHGEWTYSYDQAGFLASTTDPLGNTTSFVNDAMGRIVEKTFPDGRTESYAYDLAGNLISRAQPDGGKITFDYDQLNRQTAVQYPDGSTIATVYTANGLVQAVEEADARTTFQYDALSRETSRIDPNGFVVSTEYDLAGNKISTTSLAGVTIYGYDANNRVISVEFGEDTTRHYYNAAGDLRRSEYSNGVYETLSWSDAGRIREKSVFDSTDQLLEQLTYAYDAAGRILSTSYLDDKVQAFEYNDSGWLVTETTMVGMSEESRVEHHYDANGNRINQIDSASGVREFEYDNLNRIIRETTEGIVILYEYDSNGNLTSKTSSNGDQTTYQWDKAGRLLSVTMSVGETSNTVSYEYSPDGELMSRAVNGVTVHLIVDTARDFPQTLAEITESDTIETAYVLPAYDRGGIAQYQDAGQQVLHSDAGYSTIVVTDTSGSVSDRILYSGYGEVSNRDGTSNIKHLYNGEFRDNITGLDYLRARNYDPKTGRFISSDPFPGLTVDPITMNSYAYASADPINHTDPSGNVTAFEMKVVLGINVTLFGIGGAALGYKIAEYKEVNPIAGAIIGGITGAAVGVGATVGIAFTITSGGVTALKATAPLLTAEVLVPIAVIDVSSALVLLMSTFGLLSVAEVAKTYGIFQSLLDQSDTVPGSNVPLSSLTPQAIVEVREPGGN